MDWSGYKISNRVPGTDMLCRRPCLHHSLIVLCLLFHPSIEAFAQSSTLGASEIRERLIGNSWVARQDGQVFERLFFAEGGTTVSDPVRGFQVSGHWTLDEQTAQLCTWDATPEEPDCSGIVLQDGRYAFDWDQGAEPAISIIVEQGDVTDPSDNPGLGYRPHPDLPLPTDLNVRIPAPGESVENAALSGAWFGTIRGGQDYVIIIEKIEAAHVDLVYAWGPDLFLFNKPGWSRHRAKLEYGALKFELNSGIKISARLGLDQLLDVTADWGTISSLSHAMRLDVHSLVSQLPLEVLAPQSKGASDKSNDGCDGDVTHETGFDLSAISDLEQEIQDGEYPNTHAVLIEHAGCLVYEKYFAGEDQRWGEPLGHREFNEDSLHDLQSVSKSVTSLLLGLALKGDYAKWLDTPVVQFFEDLQADVEPEVEEVTLEHVLTMTGGLDWNDREVPRTSRENDMLRMLYARDPISSVLSQPLRDAPGTKWRYNNGLTEVLARIIERTTSRRLDLFAADALFQPLGITEYEWLGSQYWRPKGIPSGSSGLRMRARDLAKIGSLVLQKGVWEGRQIVPAEWIELSTSRHVESVNILTHGYYGYGFQWWPGKSVGIPSYPIITAVGRGGQRLFILPDQHLVVTVLAGTYDKSSLGGSGDRMLGRIASAHRRHK